MPEELRYHSTDKKGRVQAVSVWPTGYMELEFSSQAAFDRAKAALAAGGKWAFAPNGGPGYCVVPAAEKEAV